MTEKLLTGTLSLKTTNQPTNASKQRTLLDDISICDGYPQMQVNKERYWMTFQYVMDNSQMQVNKGCCWMTFQYVTDITQMQVNKECYWMTFQYVTNITQMQIKNVVG